MIEKMTEGSSERTVVGFDIRKSSSLNSLYMTSYDEDVRYEDIYDEFHDYLSGLNLFFVDPSNIKRLKIPTEARIIAFDLPTDEVEHLLKGNVSNPKPLPNIDILNGWDFMGFDVVDPITQTSVFHGFTPPIPLKELMKDYFISFGFNNNELLGDMVSALKIAKACDDYIPEHAPFSPCGIWLKR